MWSMYVSVIVVNYSSRSMLCRRLLKWSNRKGNEVFAETQLSSGRLAVSHSLFVHPFKRYYSGDFNGCWLLIQGINGSLSQPYACLAMILSESS